MIHSYYLIMKVLGTLLLAVMAFECVMAKAKVDETSDKLQILSDDHKDFFVESSGEDEYYYEDDDDYFGEEGSGDEEELEEEGEHVAFGSQANEDEGIKVVLETEKSKTTTIKTNDFHFVETTEKNEELLYEYNNEYTRRRTTWTWTR